METDDFLNKCTNTAEVIKLICLHKDCKFKQDCNCVIWIKYEGFSSWFVKNNLRE